MKGLFDNQTVGGNTLKSKVELDEVLIELSNANDYEFSGESSFVVPSFIKPTNFNIGVIVGPSGTGKSSLLKEFGENTKFKPNPNKAIASQVDLDLLMSMGLGTIPSLCRPYHVLSNGEKHRCDLAFALESNDKVFDEFTSTVHRTLARSICISLSKYLKSNNKQLVIATCHYDVAEWLEADWVFDTFTKSLNTRGLERQPINFEINPCSTKAWEFFKDFHYLTGDINKSANCWIMSSDSHLVGFYSVLSFPNGYIKNAFRGHRLVIHPDFQGLGLSKQLSDYVASLYINSNKRFFSKTAHPKLGESRERSTKWIATSKNKKKRLDYKGLNKYDAKNKMIHKYRLTYSHEYVGEI